EAWLAAGDEVGGVLTHPRHHLDLGTYPIRVQGSQLTRLAVRDLVRSKQRDEVIITPQLWRARGGLGVMCSWVFSNWVCFWRPFWPVWLGHPGRRAGLPD